MAKIIVDGIPVLVDGRKGRPPFRIRIKKKDTPRKLNPQQKVALVEYYKRGCNPAKKKEAGEAASYPPGQGAVRAVDRALKSKPIVRALRNRGIKEGLIAEKIDEGLNAMHPIKPEQPDHHARAKFIKENNTIQDFYPPKKIQSEERSVVIHLTKDDAVALNAFQKIREQDA